MARNWQQENERARAIELLRTAHGYGVCPGDDVRLANVLSALEDEGVAARVFAAMPTWRINDHPVSDERVAAIQTDTNRFHARLRALWTEAGQAGDLAQVELCRRALDGDEEAAERCARVLATTDAAASE